MVENEERRYDESHRDDVRGDLVPAALYINLGRTERVRREEIDNYLLNWLRYHLPPWSV